MSLEWFPLWLNMTILTYRLCAGCVRNTFLCRVNVVLWIIKCAYIDQIAARYGGGEGTHMAKEEQKKNCKTNLVKRVDRAWHIMFHLVSLNMGCGGRFLMRLFEKLNATFGNHIRHRGEKPLTWSWTHDLCVGVHYKRLFLMLIVLLFLASLFWVAYTPACLFSLNVSWFIIFFKILPLHWWKNHLEKKDSLHR